MVNSKVNESLTYRFDVLLATHNCSKFICPFLESLQGQTVSDWRLVIRDDFSSDDSVNLINEYSKASPNNVHFIEGRYNLGAMMNFSALLDESTADYILFADNDDIWLPEKIQKTYDEMRKYEVKYGVDTPILIHTDLKVVNEELGLLHNSLWKYQHIKPNQNTKLDALLLRNSITGCTMMINKALKNLAGPIPNEAIMHDWWIALVAAAFGKIGHVGEQTILYRQHGNNDTGAKKWSIKYIAKTFLRPKYIRERLLLKQKQAQAFLTRYKLILSQNQIQKLKILANYNRYGFVEKRYRFIQGRLSDDNLVRNIGMYLHM